MTKMWSVLLAALLLTASLAGCGSGNNPSSGSAAPSEGSTATQGSEIRELEVLRVGVAELPNHMDPMRNVGNTGIRVHYNIFETLILADQMDNYANKPMLATDWKRVDDTTLEFNLRQDVKFHDGTTMTAKDVKYSLDRLKQDDIPDISHAASLLDTIKAVEVVDDYTVRIITEGADPIIEDRIASSWGGWIMPAEYSERVGVDGIASLPIGTGPYKVVSYTPQKIVLERFEEYWGEKPAAKKIEYILYSETSSRMTALITGELDIITQLPPDQVSTIEKQKGLRVESIPITNMHVVVFNTSAGPLQDQKVRKALSLGIDRQMLVDTLWSGKAVVPRGHQFPEYGDMYFSDYPVAEFNPEQAKKILAESSYSGEEIIMEIRNNYYTFGNDAAEAMTAMWKDIGINVKINFVEKVEYDFIGMWSNSMRFPDPSGGLWLLWGPGSKAENVYWKDMPDEYRELGAELVSVTDDARRKEVARRMMEIWDEQVPGTVLYYPYESWGIRDGLEWTPYASQTMDFRADSLKVVS